MASCKLYLSLFLFNSILLLTESFAQTTRWEAPTNCSEMKNPVPVDENSILSGKKVYLTQCSPCHGEKGEGNGELSADLDPQPANHSTPDFQQQSEGAIYYKIATGRDAMPGWKQSLSENEIWNLVNFIRTLKCEQPAGIESDKIPNEIFASEQNELTASSKTGKRKFLLTGSVNSNINVDGEHFDKADFALGFSPLFLWKPTDKLFFESHIHIEAAAGNVNESGGYGHSHGQTADIAASGEIITAPSMMIDYAQLAYFINKYVTLGCGLFLSPFGIYSERLHPEWVNKLPDAPLGMTHDDLIFPATELGIQLRGRIPLGKLKINYAVYVSNGAALIDTGGNAGKLIYNNLSENNSDKAIGGRIGFFPLSNSSVEIGFSAQSAKVGASGTSYENTGALLYAGDISFYQAIKNMGGAISLKGQYSAVEVDEAFYKADSMTLMEIPDKLVNMDAMSYKFENRSSAYFMMLSYRPVFFREKFLKDCEFAARYDAMDLPGNALWENYDRRWTFGLAYWLEARSGIKVAYQLGRNKKLLLMQMVIGF